MMASVLDFIRENGGVGALAVLFTAAMLEVLLPPIPGDSIVLGGSLLVVAGAWSFPVVLSTAVAGGFVGSILHYQLGRALIGPDGSLRGGRFVERLGGSGALDRFFALFRRWGLWVIVANRALPGVRGVVFLAAGAARLSPWKTWAAGLVSNLAWSTGLLTLGVSVGGNWAKITEAFGVFQTWALALVVVLITVGLVARWWIRRRRQG